MTSPPFVLLSPASGGIFNMKWRGGRSKMHRHRGRGKAVWKITLSYYPKSWWIKLPLFLECQAPPKWADARPSGRDLRLQLDQKPLIAKTLEKGPKAFSVHLKVDTPSKVSKYE